MEKILIWDEIDAVKVYFFVGNLTRLLLNFQTEPWRKVPDFDSFQIHFASIIFVRIFLFLNYHFRLINPLNAISIVLTLKISDLYRLYFNVVLTFL